MYLILVVISILKSVRRTYMIFFLHTFFCYYNFWENCW